MLLIPNSWAELTWAQFVRLSSYADPTPIQILAVLADTDEDTILRLPVATYKEAIGKLGFLSEEPTKRFSDSITVSGITYGIDPYVLRVKDFVHLEGIQEQLKSGRPEGVAPFLSIILRPAQFDDAEADQITATLLAELPKCSYVDVLSMFFFVETLWRGSTANLTVYMVNEMEKTTNEALTALANVGSSSRLCTRWSTRLAKFGIKVLKRFWDRLVMNSLAIGNGERPIMNRNITRIIIKLLNTTFKYGRYRY